MAKSGALDSYCDGAETIKGHKKTALCAVFLWSLLAFASQE
jgi:hypothetical protein